MHLILAQNKKINTNAVRLCRVLNVQRLTISRLRFVCKRHDTGHPERLALECVRVPDTARLTACVSVTERVPMIQTPCNGWSSGSRHTPSHKPMTGRGHNAVCVSRSTSQAACAAQFVQTHGRWRYCTPSERVHLCKRNDTPNTQRKSHRRRVLPVQR